MIIQNLPNCDEFKHIFFTAKLSLGIRGLPDEIETCARYLCFVWFCRFFIKLSPADEISRRGLNLFVSAGL
jgi:hypothetical protein